MQNQTFKLSLKPNDYPPNVPVVFADQYDEGRTFAATVYDTDGSLYTFNGETVTVVGTKPSGTGFSYTATASGNTVTFETTGQMTVVAGNVTCGIIIEKDGDRIGTLHFVLHVQPAALSTDTIIDSDDFGSIISDAVAEYMEEHGIVIDDTLTVAGAAADAKATGDAVDELKSAITEKLILEERDNKWNPNNTKSGYMAANGTEGSNASYEHLIDPIPVQPGDVVRSYEISSLGNFAVAGMRWLCAMDSNKTAVAASGSNSNITSYTVPDGIYYINPTMNIGGQKRMITINMVATQFIDYAPPYYVASPDFIGTLNIDENTDFDDKYLDYSMVGRLDPAACEIGKFINGTTGAITDNASYYVTGYMDIKPGETLYVYQKNNKAVVNMRSIAAYDKDKVLIPTKGTNTETDHFTQSEDVAFIRASIVYNSSGLYGTPYGVGCMANSDPEYVTVGGNPTVKDKNIRTVIKVYKTDTEAQIIGKFVEAFDTGNCDVVFQRGSYTFGTALATVESDYHLLMNEIPIGNNCRYFFNGSTIAATIDLSNRATDYYCNLFGTQKRPSSFEMHDGVLIATDAVYVMHDESAGLSGSYKHLYENMEMHYHTVNQSRDIRKCIGGGTGESGVVEIVGCKFSTDNTDACVSFHGNDEDTAGSEFDMNVRNSWFSNGIRVSSLSTSQTARLFYSSNSATTAPYTTTGCVVTEFLNEIRT